MSTVVVRITAEIFDANTLGSLGTFRVVDTSDLEADEPIAQAIDYVLEIADDANKWEKVA